MKVMHNIKTLYCKVKEVSGDHELIDLTFDTKDMTRVATYDEIILGIEAGCDVLMDGDKVIQYIRLDDGIYKWNEVWEYNEEFKENEIVDCGYMKVNTYEQKND